MSVRTVRLLALGFVALILAALGVWYITLAGRTSSIEELGDARGFGESIPTFEGTSGSTYTNMVSGVETATPAEQGAVPKLWRVTSAPVAGAGFVYVASNGATSSRPTLRFVESATGYVFDANPETGEIVRRTHTLVPKVHEALVARSGRVILRFLGEDGMVRTLSAESATSTGGTGALVGRELPPQITAITFSPEGDSVFYILPDEKGGFSGVRAKSDGSAPQAILSTAISGWRLAWAQSGIVLTQKAAAGIPGISFALRDNVTLPLVRDVPGLLVTESRTGTLLYSSFRDGTLELFLRLAGTAAPLKLPIATVADKCAWGGSMVAWCAVPQGALSQAFLDNWFRGSEHTNDSWWRLDARDGTAEPLSHTSSSDEPLDVRDPIADAAGRYIAFIHARDGSLWLLRTDDL